MKIQQNTLTKNKIKPQKFTSLSTQLPSTCANELSEVEAVAKVFGNFASVESWLNWKTYFSFFLLWVFFSTYSLSNSYFHHTSRQILYILDLYHLEGLKKNHYHGKGGPLSHIIGTLRRLKNARNRVQLLRRKLILKLISRRRVFFFQIHPSAIVGLNIKLVKMISWRAEKNLNM